MYGDNFVPLSSHARKNMRHSNATFARVQTDIQNLESNTGSKESKSTTTTAKVAIVQTGAKDSHSNKESKESESTTKESTLKNSKSNKKSQ